MTATIIITTPDELPAFKFLDPNGEFQAGGQLAHTGAVYYGSGASPYTAAVEGVELRAKNGNVRLFKTSEAAQAAARDGLPPIRDISVHSDGFRMTVHWTIGERRFHVWIDARTNEPEDIVHSNPVTPTPGTCRNEHRGLDRTSKTQAAIWNYVFGVVKRGDLIRKERLRVAGIQARNLRRHELSTAAYDINALVLEWFAAGGPAGNQTSLDIAELYARYQAIEAERDTIGRAKEER